VNARWLREHHEFVCLQEAAGGARYPPKERNAQGLLDLLFRPDPLVEGFCDEGQADSQNEAEQATENGIPLRLRPDLGGTVRWLKYTSVVCDQPAFCIEVELLLHERVIPRRVGCPLSLELLDLLFDGAERVGDRRPVKLGLEARKLFRVNVGQTYRVTGIPSRDGEIEDVCVGLRAGA
jgi:hypothetical protein